jgi:hypothetical protein
VDGSCHKIKLSLLGIINIFINYDINPRFPHIVGTVGG